ncbi:MAG: hypothetical protein UY03_C0011G0013 [Parcubacteria group bacterium GW2011_GWA2_47_64]|nr:MAG: hypothetical protein UY03_C0011G0013 [Parcubacteria group bacterium GW2011_GWA2_47_64]KKU96988.1 MAG: hypothetical protein UY29_C0004G0042 [Parcubacteria group bacterium GW2011_GWC2_48_17]
MTSASVKKMRGFTLIELLVVISIIGLLSSVVLASLNTARSKARDARRKSDLNEIRTALEFYLDKYGTYKVAGSGWNGGGQGFLGYENGANYPTSVTRVLNNEGFLGAPLIDDPKTKPGYMIYLCDSYKRAAISATLENPSAGDIAYIQTTCNGTGSNGTYTNYGKNYALELR